MPIYEYHCARCGVFTALRPMAEYREPQPCPDCGTAAPRTMITAPRLATLSAGMRKAHVTNEKSRHEPKTAAAAPAPARRSPDAPRAAKSFPRRRPWMISH